MDYKLLKALAAVLDAGGFEKAAQHLNLTQSAVSQRIRLLEDQIGAILLTRTSPPVATEAGEPHPCTLQKSPPSRSGTFQ